MLLAVPMLISRPRGVFPFSPSGIAGLKLWLKADSLALNDGDLISTWTDSSGNGFNATAAGTARPTYKTAIQNGYPIVRYAGSPNSMTTSPVVSAQPDTIIVVASQTSKTTVAAFVNGVAPKEQQLRLTTSGFFTIYSGSASLNESVDRSGAFHVFTGVFNGASSFGYVDGSQVISGNPGSVAGSTLYIGSNDPTITIFLKGDIAEILIYDTALSGTNRGLVEAYLKTKWATP